MTDDDVKGSVYQIVCIHQKNNVCPVFHIKIKPHAIDEIKTKPSTRPWSE